MVEKCTLKREIGASSEVAMISQTSNTDKACGIGASLYPVRTTERRTSERSVYYQPTKSHQIVSDAYT